MSEELFGITQKGFDLAVGKAQASSAHPSLKINPTSCEFAPCWVEIHGYVDPEVIMEECRRTGATNWAEGDEDYVVQFMVGSNAGDGYDAVPEERLVYQLERLR
jgi:hypothetical protein